MSYVQRVLQPGEVVRHTATIHWIVYWPAAVLLLVGFAGLIYVWVAPPEHRVLYWVALGLAALVSIAGLLLLVREWFSWWTTEVVITNLRVIYKTGLIRRKTNEMNMDKVESVQVEQSILGRILDYGEVTITGTGAGLEALSLIARPIELRNTITGVSHSPH